MRILNNPKIANIAQNTMAAVAIETALKSIGRPAFIYLDKNKNTTSETKKYSATKEFLYQALCLGVYLTMIPVFKKAGYKIAKKVFADDNSVQKVFKHCSEPFKNKGGVAVKEYKRFMYEYNLAKENYTLTKGMKKIKGGIEATSIVGSVFGLALFAPKISNMIIHPLMKIFPSPKNENTNINIEA